MTADAIVFPDPWWDLRAPDETTAQVREVITGELQREIARGHPLAGIDRSASAKTIRSTEIGATAGLGPSRANAARRRRARRKPSRARFIATRRTHCSGTLKSRTFDQRADALAKASWTASSASPRSPVTRYTWPTSRPKALW